MAKTQTDDLQLILSPFTVGTESALKLASEKTIRAKHWFRVIYRHWGTHSQKWSGWMRWCPPVDMKSENLNGQFKTKAAAKAMVAKQQASHAKRVKAGKQYVDLGGLVAEMKVEKGEKYQYVILEEVTMTLGQEVVG